jgi:hypothetical protein
MSGRDLMHPAINPQRQLRKVRRQARVGRGKLGYDLVYQADSTDRLEAACMLS